MKAAPSKGYLGRRQSGDVKGQAKHDLQFGYRRLVRIITLRFKTFVILKSSIVIATIILNINACFFQILFKY